MLRTSLLCLLLVFVMMSKAQYEDVASTEPDIQSDPEVQENTLPESVIEESPVTEETSEESQVTEEPQVSEESQVLEEPQVAEEPQVLEELQVAQEPQVPEESQASENMEVTSEDTSSIMNMWQQISETFSQHKEKEKYCLAKMVKCITDPSITVPEVADIHEPVNIGVALALQETGSNIVRSTPYRCNMQNFVGAHRCCSSQPSDFFKGAILFACSEGQAMVPRSVLQEYLLNIGQEDNGSVNLTSTDTFAGSMLGSAVCFTDCLFRKRFLVTNEGYIQLAMVRHHFTNAVGRTWLHATLDALANCSSIVPSKCMVAQNSADVTSLVLHRDSPRTKDAQITVQSRIMSRAAVFIDTMHAAQITAAAECDSKMQKLKVCDIFKT